MASSDVDQKYLGRLAHSIEQTNLDLSDALFQTLGLSVLLSRKVYRARKLRRLDTTRDTRSLQLYHHIIWLSKEGLDMLERYVLPLTQDGQEGPEVQVLAAKLRASFLHVFCLFHNDPPVTVAHALNAAIPSSSQDSSSSVKKTTPPKRNSRGKQPSLRDPINSVASDTSFLTNPYADLPLGSTPPMTFPSTPGAPPGLSSVAIPHPSAFIFPSINFIPYAEAYFRDASIAAAALLPGAHPIRLSVAIEHAAFLWDVRHDHPSARQLARKAIRQLRDGEEEGVTDEAFEDAAEMVQILGRIMKRKSFEGTPRTTQDTSASSSARPPAAYFVPAAEVIRTPPQEDYSGGRRRSATTDANNVTPISARYPNNITYSQADAMYASNSPGVEGGPVGGTPPRRRETVKHRRGQSAPQPSTTSHRNPVTPPKPPPKDEGYTPGGSSGRRDKGKSPAVQPVSPSRRRSSSGKNVNFATPPRIPVSPVAADSGYSPAIYATAYPTAYPTGYPTSYPVVTPTKPTYQYGGTNGLDYNGNELRNGNGYYSTSATDQRGKGER